MSGGSGESAPAGLREPAPAKLNLYLHVTGRRPDGYHLLDSLAVFVDLGEALSATPAAGLALRLDGPFADALADMAPGDNLVLQAARQLQALSTDGERPPAGADMTLTKAIPVAAGLGGGSADAAAALRLLPRLWGRALPQASLDRLAAGLGADVPVCLASRPALMEGTGEILSPAPPLPDLHLVLVNPRLPVPTGAVFAGLQGRFSAPDPLQRPPASLPDLAAALARRGNDLERPARFLAPAVDRVLAALAAQDGCLLARMSGSGATCFGLFAHPPGATRAAAALRRAEPGWWVTAARSPAGGASES